MSIGCGGREVTHPLGKQRSRRPQREERRLPAAVPPMRVFLRHAFISLLIAALLGLGGAALIVRAGLYDVAASSSHTQWVHSLLETAMHHSVRWHARNMQPPPTRRDDTAHDATHDTASLRGAACYREHCLSCHGAPGIAPGPLSLGMQPLPGPLVDAADKWALGEIYWIVLHGIKMSGMPAWSHRLPEADLWAVARHVQQLGQWSPRDYAALRVAGECETLPAQASSVAARPAWRAAPSPAGLEAGRLALRQYGCTGCHSIPGVTGPRIDVGPPLEGLARRSVIAGRLPNTHEQLVQWIQQPQRLRPGSAMPDLGVTREHAAAMADVLMTLH
jgi:mono/diheme cytochrome c family protein